MQPTETPRRQRVTHEVVEFIANFPSLPLDGSPSEHSIRLDDVRGIAREVLESRTAIAALRQMVEAACNEDEGDTCCGCGCCCDLDHRGIRARRQAIRTRLAALEAPDE